MKTNQETTTETAARHTRDDAAEARARVDEFCDDVHCALISAGIDPDDDLGWDSVDAMIDDDDDPAVGDAVQAYIDAISDC